MKGCAAEVEVSDCMSAWTWQACHTIEARRGVVDGRCVMCNNMLNYKYLSSIFNPAHINFCNTLTVHISNGTKLLPK